MKLKIGEEYMMRNGEKSEPVKATGFKQFPFTAGDHIYTSDGFWLSSDKPDPIDLIKPWSERAFGEMTEAEREDLRAAERAGKRIESYLTRRGRWMRVNPGWYPEVIYRIAPGQEEHGVTPEIGRRYRRRDGKISKPVKAYDSPDFPFSCASEVYTTNGRYLLDGTPHRYDLIELVGEPTPRPEWSGWENEAPTFHSKWRNGCDYEARNIGGQYSSRVRPLVKDAAE